MQSRRHKRQHYNARHGPRGGREPVPREEPDEPRAGADIGGVTLDWYGRRYALRFLVPGITERGTRPRSDQIAVEIDGQWRRMSLRAALLHLAGQPGRVLPRRYRN